jgi:drug/metabolite transporter (DMT)-like permease
MTGTLKSDGNLRRATLYIVLSALSFALAGTVIKLLSDALPTVTLVFWRNLFSFAALMLWFGWVGFPELRTRRLGAHLWRALFTYGALLAYFFAVREIPLATAVLLQSSAPIFVPLLAFLVFGRLSDRYVWSGVVVGFLGVACIVAPSQLGVSLGEAGGLLAGALGGAATLAIWAMSSSEPAARQMAYFTGLTLLISLVPLPWYWALPSLEALPALLGLGVFTTLAQHLLALGCATAPTDKIITWSYISIVFAAIIAYLGWQEAITPRTVAGVILVIAGARWTMRGREPVPPARRRE